MPSKKYFLTLMLGVLAVHAAYASNYLPEETPYSAEIKDVVDVRPVEGRDIVNATLVLDHEVPNSEASIILRNISFGNDVIKQVLRVYQTPDGKRMDSGKPTKYLHLQWAPKADRFTADKLKGTVLQLNAFRYVRKITTVKDLGSVGERPFHNAELTLDGFVPNGWTTLVVDLGGGPVRRTLLSNPTVLTGHATTQVHIQCALDELDKLSGKTIRIYSPQLPEVR